MKVLLLEIPSDDHAFGGYLGGKAIQEILSLLKIDYDYRLILSKKYFLKALKKLSNYDILHIECHSDQEGISCDPYNRSTPRGTMSWIDLSEELYEIDLEGKQLVLSGCLAGSIDSDADILADKKIGFRRVFAFDEEIEYDRAVAVWSGFYYLVSRKKQPSPRDFAVAVGKLNECFGGALVYFVRLEKGKIRRFQGIKNKRV